MLFPWSLLTIYSRTEENITNYAFLIEDAGNLAKRHQSVVIKTQNLTHADLNSYYEGLFCLFHFMIGNTDFYMKNQHNLKLIRKEGNIKSPPIPIPYDFDFSGLVNAPYAKPARGVRIRSVRERIYLGNCRPDNELNKLFDLFLSKENEISQLIANYSLLDDDQKTDVLEYIKDFYTILNDKRLQKKKIIKKCW